MLGMRLNRVCRGQSDARFGLQTDKFSAVYSGKFELQSGPVSARHVAGFTRGPQ